MQCNIDEASNNHVTSPRYQLAPIQVSSPAIASSAPPKAHQVTTPVSGILVGPAGMSPSTTAFPSTCNRSSIDRNHDLKLLPLRLVTFLLSPTRKPNQPLSVAEDLPIARRSEDPLPESSTWRENMIVEFHICAGVLADFREAGNCLLRSRFARRGLGSCSWCQYLRESSYRLRVLEGHCRDTGSSRRLRFSRLDAKIFVDTTLVQASAIERRV